MIVLLGVVAIVYAWQLASRPHVRPWVAWLMPIAVAVIGCVLWRRETGDNRGPIALEMAVIEVLTLASLAGGFAYRRHRVRAG